LRDDRRLVATDLFDIRRQEPRRLLNGRVLVARDDDLRGHTPARERDIARLCTSVGAHPRPAHRTGPFLRICCGRDEERNGQRN
jgi:hypothetical protein